MRGNARILTVLLCLTLILGLCGCSCRHEWVDATCTEPKTCAKCGETQGEALGHTPGEWQQDEPDYVTSVIWLRQYCTVCGAEVDVDMKALSSYCQDGTLLLSPEEFAERLDNLFGTLTNRYGLRFQRKDHVRGGGFHGLRGSKCQGRAAFASHYSPRRPAAPSQIRTAGRSERSWRALPLRIPRRSSASFLP